MNPVRTFEIFAAVARERSFSKVARSEQVNVSSISRTIEALEREWGVRLFHRTTRTVSLTPAGSIYFARIESLLSSLAEAKEEAVSAMEAPRGRIKVAAPVSFSRLYMGRLYAKFRERFPEIDLVLVSSNSVSDLIDEGFDFAVRIGGLTDSSFVARRIAESRQVLCASPLYLHRSGAPAKPADLATHHCLMSDRESTRGRWYYSRPRVKRAVAVAGPFKSNQGDVLVEAAKSGLGIGLLPLWLVQRELADGSLVSVLPEYEWDFSPSGPAAIQIIYPHRKALTRSARAFLEFLSKELATVLPVRSQP
jgi:DNA-binding transcriptional LysR family regulator